MEIPSAGNNYEKFFYVPQAVVRFWVQILAIFLYACKALLAFNARSSAKKKSLSAGQHAI